MLLSKRDEEKMIIKLANEGKTTREIAKEIHISLKTIGQILNKAIGDDEDKKRTKTRVKVRLCQSLPDVLRWAAPNGGRD